MSQEARTVIAAVDPDVAAKRAQTVKAMADHLVAAVLHGTLNTSKDQEIVECLMAAPDGYHTRAVFDHMDDAKAAALAMLDEMDEAKLDLVNKEMALG